MHHGQSTSDDVAGGLLNSLEEGLLENDHRWDASNFGQLERFIYDFLVGGASAGESVRLKLQTPLFVADALLAAAQKQLEQELQVATLVSVLACYVMVALAGCCKPSILEYRQRMVVLFSSGSAA